jgi:hypothetical protein
MEPGTTKEVSTNSIVQLSRPEALSKPLSRVIQRNNRIEALFQLCLTIPDSDYDRNVPTYALATAYRCVK